MRHPCLYLKKHQGNGSTVQNSLSEKLSVVNDVSVNICSCCNQQCDGDGIKYNVTCVNVGSMLYARILEVNSTYLSLPWQNTYQTSCIIATITDAI